MRIQNSKHKNHIREDIQTESNQIQVVELLLSVSIYYTVYKYVEQQNKYILDKTLTNSSTVLFCLKSVSYLSVHVYRNIIVL